MNNFEDIFDPVLTKWSKQLKKMLEKTILWHEVLPYVLVSRKIINMDFDNL